LVQLIKNRGKKLEGLGYYVVKLHDATFNRFWLIHNVWRTDGRAIT